MPVFEFICSKHGSFDQTIPFSVGLVDDLPCPFETEEGLVCLVSSKRMLRPPASIRIIKTQLENIQRGIKEFGGD